MSGKVQSDTYLLDRARRRFKQRYIIDPVTGCWNWTAGKEKHGDSYRAKFTMPREGQATPAARCAWKLFKGDIPNGGHVLHHCDNPLCVNYEEHLYLGDHARNMKDKQDRKRQWNNRDPERHARIMKSIASHPGETNGAAKLTWAEVREIRTSKEMGRALARQYNVHFSLISLIRRNKIWREHDV